MSPALTKALERLHGELARLRGDAFFESAARVLCAEAGADAAYIADGVRSLGTLRTRAFVVDGATRAGAEPYQDTLGGSAARVGSCASPFEDTPRAFVAELAITDACGDRDGVVAVLSRRAFDDDDALLTLLQLFAVRIGAELDRLAVEAELEDLFDLSPDALFVVDPLGVIVRANHEASALFGYAREELVGASIELLVPVASRQRHQMLRAVDGQGRRRMGAHAGRDFVGRRRDGSELLVDVALGRVRHGRTPMTLAAVRDASAAAAARAERQALEAELRSSQAVRAVGALAGGIAHDFNNLLSVVVANTDVALSTLEHAHPAFEPLSDIVMASARAREVVHQIAAMSRNQLPRRVVVPAREVVDDVAKLIRAVAHPGCEVRVRCDEPSPSVFADPIQLHRLLMNLATNACQALDRRPGSICLDVALVQAPDEHLGRRPPAVPLVRFQIRDDGVGMDAGTRARLFEPFFTTKSARRGTGLGLAIVQAIVASHEGAIDVESAPGAGTSVTVTLPATSVPRATTVRPTPIPHAHTLRARVACIDDDPAVMAAMVRMLAVLGCRADGFTSPEEALAAMANAEPPYDCVLTDYTMPTLSGLEVARCVGAMRPGTPVVIMSALPRGGAIEPVAPVAAWLEKPISRAVLAGTIRSLVPERR